jgi:hypothetical protein
LISQSRGLGDVYKRQDTALALTVFAWLCCVGAGLFLHEKVEVPVHHWVSQKTKPFFLRLAR